MCFIFAVFSPLYRTKSLEEMNEQNSKKILFNKSTLISLKAELLKKQEEIFEKKQQPQNQIENFKPPRPKPSEKTDDPLNAKKTFKDGLKAVDVEELEAIKKSKMALEKKAELYEHLADGAGHSQLASNFLVDFNTKKQQESTREPSPPLELETDDNDNEWTEFTDCLGRTRKCLKSDLDFYMEKDQELIRISSKERSEATTEDAEVKEKPLLVQKTNDYLQSLRAKWEEKERELLAKEKDIHYQDILYDEARQHGVAYYNFSTDEMDRRKQMEELLKRREETLRAQRESEETRKKREELLAARVKAARARQRLRAGLPPEDPEEQNKKEFTAHLLEFLTKQKNEADEKAKEEERRIREEKEKERQKLREAYVREWDLGKEGVDDKVKRFRELTQEEYMEQQRARRIDEFAPPKATSSSRSDYTFDERGMKTRDGEHQSTSTVANKSWADVRPKRQTSQPPAMSDLEEEKGLYFSSKKAKTDANKYANFVKARDESKPTPNEGFDYADTRKVPETKMKYRSFMKEQEPTPIVNEVEEPTQVYDRFDLDTREKADERLQNYNRFDLNHSEVAPPPTYEYYGPVSKRVRHQNPFDSDINEAYAQGVKSLQKEPSKRKLLKDYDFALE